MDYNSIRRMRYASMSNDEKEALLRRRREKRKQKRLNVSKIGRQIKRSIQNRKIYVSKEKNTCAGAIPPVPQITTDIPICGDHCGINHSHSLAPLDDNMHHTPNISQSATSHESHGCSSSNVFHQSQDCTRVLLPSAASDIASSQCRQPVQTTHQARSKKKRPRTTHARVLRIPCTPLILPQAPDCRYCHAKRFHLEPPNFCCSGGRVCLVSSVMPYDLSYLFTESAEECVKFRKAVRTYNNNFGFTSFGAKYDSDLTKNTHGVYTFRVQGQVHHSLPSLFPTGSNSTGIQLYFYEHEAELSNRLCASHYLCESTLRLLMRILQQNPYTRFFKDLREVTDLDRHTILLNSNPGLDQRVYNCPAVSQVAAIWTEDDHDSVDKTAHIQVYTHSNVCHRIQHYFACYDTLQYPLLFPHGESGWHRAIPKKNAQSNINSDLVHISMVNDPCIQNADDVISHENALAEEGTKGRDMVSAREYYSYKFQIREEDRSMLLHTRRLLQQFAVDVYVKIETCRLNFLRKKQDNIRTDILRGVLDSVSCGNNRGNQIGRRIYLPSSFIGGPRDMRRRYIDAMCLVQKYGKPDLFMTMTCNPMWKEIQDNLKYGEEAQDRPDLVSRVFRAKFEVLKGEILKKKIFGEVAAFVYVIEFQKRGLPHAHMLLVLKKPFKLTNPEAYDQHVSAEIPDPVKEPYLHFLVMKHMMHGPCGSLNPKNVCMKNGKCKNHYPKDFCEYTAHCEDGYPHYKRTNNGRTVRVRNCYLDNRWVVPYSPYLLACMDCHINVEICSTVKLVKYLYKYVYKGHDRVSFHIHSQDNYEEVDEIHDFVSARWVAAAEAFWRIYGFTLNEMSPCVYTLQLHLQGEQIISFHKNSNLSQLLSDVDFSKTMLTEFFSMNRNNSKARALHCLYREFPEYFVWNRSQKKWTPRKCRKVVGRVVTVSPSEGERYYLRLLLSHVRSPTSFEDLLIVNGHLKSSYREAASCRGLLQSDTYIEETLDEATTFQLPSSLRVLFATLLLFCSPSNPRHLWEKFEDEMSRDFETNKHVNGYDSEQIRRTVLHDLNRVLEQSGKHIADYHLIDEDIDFSTTGWQNKEIESEKNVDFVEEDALLASRLNAGQQEAYNAIMNAVTCADGKCFFIDGPGGTGKTFLYRAILGTLRSAGHIALAVASSGVAASILPGGRTAHSRFKIPIDASENKSCHISKQSSVAKLIALASLILWDEASMAKRDTIEAFDLLLKDIMDNQSAFGGKTVVFGGDFRQTLPVIQSGTKNIQINASFLNSALWSQLNKISLTENMRAAIDPDFANFLLRVGEGYEEEDKEGRICIHVDMLVPYSNKDDSVNRLINYVFTDFTAYSVEPYGMINRCILSATNNAVDEVNGLIIDRFPGETCIYTSIDRTVNENDQGEYEDFLNSLNPKGLPPHKLILKKNCPVILLRNLNPVEGLCNGTRLICKELKQNSICAEIAFGQHRGKQVLLPRIPLQSSDNEKNGIPFRRTQFPVKLCFAMTINKAQGQTLDYVGIYLREPVFSHGQLYVALSRAKTSTDVKVLIVPPNSVDNVPECKTRNVVYTEVFELCAQ